MCAVSYLCSRIHVSALARVLSHVCAGVLMWWLSALICALGHVTCCHAFASIFVLSDTCARLCVARLFTLGLFYSTTSHFCSIYTFLYTSPQHVRLALVTECQFGHQVGTPA